MAILAIALSIVFYRLSDAASRATTEAAKGIAASVERLEKLFDKLYSDTFSMMRDTVSDMRKHIWPQDDGDADNAIEEVEKKADEKIAAVKKEIEQQVGQILQRQKIADDKVASVTADMRRVVERAIVNSRQAESEAREETVREHLMRTLRVLRARRSKIVLEDILSRLGPIFPVPRVFHELERMKDEGIISFEAPFQPTTEILYRPNAWRIANPANKAPEPTP